ncbi:hypothetical protein As57867_006983, partial [Aphanomyces stellatus]
CILSEFDTHHIPYDDLKNPINGQPVGDAAIMVKVSNGCLKPTITSSCPLDPPIGYAVLVLEPQGRPTAMQNAHVIRTNLNRTSTDLRAGFH